MPTNFHRSFGLWAAALCAGFSLAWLAAGRPLWSGGIAVGGAWLYLNLFMLMRLLEMGLDAKGRRKSRILVYSVLKFPVLYVAGFFILKARYFPVYSVLTGLTIVLATFAFAWSRAAAGASSSVRKAGVA